LVGGTVGGYISFAGAHRLLDAGIKGKRKFTPGNKKRRKWNSYYFNNAFVYFLLCWELYGVV
jgi:Mn2+/Fe2+ NRAMP family transporter